jgi:hypothetical protein
MEYRQYVQWCEEYGLPVMDFYEWECGWITRGMQMRRDQIQGPQADVIDKRERKGEEYDVAQNTDQGAKEKEAARHDCRGH